MSVVFVGDVGTEIILECGSDISSATTRSIRVRKPSGAKLTWDADSSGTTAIKYVTQTGDIDVSGIWEMQAYVETTTWRGLGEVCRLTVMKGL